MEAMTNWMLDNPEAARWISIGGVLLLCVFVFFVTKRLLLALLTALIRKSSVRWDDILLEKGIFSRLAYLAPTLVIYHFAFLAEPAQAVVIRLASAAMVLIFILSATAFLNAANAIYESTKMSHGRPIKAYIQVVKIVLTLFGFVVVVAVLFERSPWVFLSGLGAMTAVLLLIFKDTILSFVASIQILTYDMIQLGDWIEVPQYGADGDVVDISLHTIKVQNFDKTITTIPTYKLIEGSFKNWRGMTLSGGRRIKRSIHIDMSTIRFCDAEMVGRFEKIRILEEYIRTKREELQHYNEEHGIDDSVLVNGRRMTNIGTFRAYMQAYLRNHPSIDQRMTFLIRQLSPGPHGLPLEVYVFANDTNWVKYEAIQADIFDHLLAVVPQFGLRMFQYPTGYDFNPDADRP